MKFGEVVGITPMLLLTKRCMPMDAQILKKGKMVEGDSGQFLEKYKLGLLEICCVYSSYLIHLWSKFHEPTGSRFGDINKSISSLFMEKCH
jgi:hypothetical protein